MQTTAHPNQIYDNVRINPLSFLAQYLLSMKSVKPLKKKKSAARAMANVRYRLLFVTQCAIKSPKAERAEITESISQSVLNLDLYSIVTLWSKRAAKIWRQIRIFCFSSRL